MSKSVIIVESPAKTKTLKSFLGAKYEVEASMGHVRDLPKTKLGVDTEDDFKPTYVTIAERKSILSHLKTATSKADIVYLATDPDREGEAIAWHLANALKLKNAKRITFNEITKTAVTEALANPREVDDDLVDAQQARRVLDRLVGYKLSPLLWSKVRKGLSAGRVQSVSVRLICDREREILAFVPEEYWSVTARLTKIDSKKQFDAKLVEKDGKKLKVGCEEESKQILSDLQDAEYKVLEVKERQQKRNPAAPFITSTLQQEASRKLGFSGKKTMTVAQGLYEGVEIGKEGTVGLITYMRTDSTRIAAEAVAQARELIQDQYGKEFLPAAPRQYKSKKSAQDAHEAIRPTSVFRRPEEMEKFLNRDQLRLYRLIWQRFLASQMESAVLNIVTIDIGAKNYTFRASGSTVKFAGFTILYTEGKDAGNGKDEDENQVLPALSKDELLKLIELLPKQHFTEPPPRYTDATLVKALEERGIGRPSTYAAIISTIQDRKYVVMEEKKFKPTELGFTVTDLLVKHFPEIMEVEFTALIEAKLDDIEEGDAEWVEVIREFWRPFLTALENAKEHMESVKTPAKETGEMCPNCGKPLVIRESRFGQFLGCSGYPKCRTVVSKGLGEPCPVPDCGGTMVEEKPGSLKYVCSNHPTCGYVSRGKAPETPAAEGEAAPTGEDSGQVCPKCGKPLVRRQGRYGEFLGCSGYPKCKTIIAEPKTIGLKCPKEGCDGDIVEKRSRRGIVFYGCSKYPDCDFVSWDKPLDRKCPTCGSMLVEKQFRGKSQGIKCSSEDCDYKEQKGESETETA
jgi:DNA topoisomerase-1